MKRLVNGVEVDLTPGHAEINTLPDRVVVRSKDGSHTAGAVRVGNAVLVSYKGRQYRVEPPSSHIARHGSSDSGEIRAPMPGLIVDLLKAPGNPVAKGEKILVLEAMKTQQAFSAPFDGTVSKIAVAKGQQVVEGDLLAIVDPNPA